MSFIGSLPVALGALILTLAGKLFNWLVLNTIVLFKPQVYDVIASGIELTWTAFRDIANILIIGIFTFIAISIILGLKEFGQKRLIARVLIIAVLINFSLLFTKMIIDASNFTASQFYYAAAISSQGNAVSLGQESTATQQQTSDGIAGGFMRAMGVTTVGNAYNTVREFAKNQDSGWLALAYGLLAGFFFFAAAIVLLYGCFLLVSRAILLIFLMITASLAFASYLIPAWETSHYGWKTWWDSLIKSAVFAPVLMLFLWATLNIANRLHGPGTQAGSLGDLATNPDKTANLAVLFNYLVVLGMLFVSFKLSSSLAGKISGFSLASLPASWLAGMGAKYSGRFLRNTVGSAAQGWQERYGRRAGDLMYQQAKAQRGADQARRAGNFALAGQAQREADRLKKLAAGPARWANRFGSLADSKFNIMDTAAGKAIAKQAGLAGLSAGASAKGGKSYAGKIKAAGEAGEKQAPKITEDQKKAIREEAGQGAIQNTKQHREQLQAGKQASKEMKEAIQQVVKEQKDMMEQMRVDANKNLKETERAHRDSAEAYERTIQRIDSDIRAGKSGARDELEMAKTKREIELKSEAAKIEQAHNTLKEIEAKAANLSKSKQFFDKDGKKIAEFESTLEEATAKERQADAEIAQHEKMTAELAEKLYKEGVESLESARADIAAEIGKREAGPIAQFTITGDRVAKETRSRLKKSSERSSLLKLIDEEIKKEGTKKEAAAPKEEKK